MQLLLSYGLGSRVVDLPDRLQRTNLEIRRTLLSIERNLPPVSLCSPDRSLVGLTYGYGLQ